MRAAVLTGKSSIEILEQKTPGIGEDDVRVRIKAGGICGSDLHYFYHYRMGDFPVREPFILGHEAAGVIEAVGTNVERLQNGDLVVINPSHPCRHCSYCFTGRQLLCADMRFLGSSRKYPHIQGMFSQTFTTNQSQCYKLPSNFDVHHAAFAEPLSVAMHAVQNAGALIGANVLISGSGPIGCLILMAARLAGANTITITDIKKEPLRVAEDIGASRALDISQSVKQIPLTDDPRGSFDVAFEASGNQAAVLLAIKNLKPGGTFVQVGTFKNTDISIPSDLIMTKELTLKSSFRFDKEFSWATEYLATQRVNVQPLLSHIFPMEDANEAFHVAQDRNSAMKVHLSF